MSDEPFVRMIPLSKLVPSDANVRRTARDAGIEELAASIAAHGLLQNLTVRPVLDTEGIESGKFEVVAGGRRFMALKLLAKRKAIPRNHPVPCALAPGFSGEEVSLAENVCQAPMHPADQYEAFAKLYTEQGVPIEDIAARFGVTPAVVRQRLRLGSVSPALMAVYRDGGMTLEQLMAFTIADDHALQERVWKELSWNKSKEMIRHLLTEKHVDAADPRARFIGVDAYAAAGGTIIRDLFDTAHEGYFDNPELVNRLVLEKLEKEAEVVVAEGWKWVTVTPDFHYSITSGMRRVHPQAVELSAEQQTQLDTLESEREVLALQYQDIDMPEDAAARWQTLETEIDALTGVECYRPEDIAICGAFVSFDDDGSLRVERGFLRPEDDPVKTANGSAEVPEADGVQLPQDGDGGGDDDGGPAPLSDRLVIELTAHRTAGLRNTLAQNSGMALLALTHALATQLFYGSGDASCLAIEMKSASLNDRAPGIDGSKATREIAKRVKAWATQMPREVDGLWTFLAGLDHDRLLELLAVCVAPSVNALKLPWDRDVRREQAADHLAGVLVLDMTQYWTPTAASYFGSVTKARILDAVREAVSEDAAARLADLKKEPMAKAAEKLLKSSAWLPALLRTPKIARENTAAVMAIAAE